jgi:hypothetical protein
MVHTETPSAARGPQAQGGRCEAPYTRVPHVKKWHSRVRRFAPSTAGSASRAALLRLCKAFFVVFVSFVVFVVFVTFVCECGLLA